MLEFIAWAFIMAGIATVIDKLVLINNTQKEILAALQAKQPVPAKISEDQAN